MYTSHIDYTRKSEKQLILADSVFFIKRKQSSEVLSSLPELEIKLHPLVVSVEDLKQGGASSCSTPPGNMHIWQLTSFAALSTSANAWKTLQVFDFGVRNKFERVGKFINTKSANNKNQLCRENQKQKYQNKPPRSRFCCI